MPVGDGATVLVGGDVSVSDGVSVAVDVDVFVGRGVLVGFGGVFVVVLVGFSATRIGVGVAVGPTTAGAPLRE